MVYYSVSKSQLDWINLPHSPTVTDKHQCLTYGYFPSQYQTILLGNTGKQV